MLLYEPSIIVKGRGIVLTPLPALLCEGDMDAIIGQSPIPTEQFYEEIQRVKQNKSRHAR